MKEISCDQCGQDFIPVETEVTCPNCKEKFGPVKTKAKK